jgi:hypothetical protein
MVKALAGAFRWRRMVDTGAFGTLEDLARAKGVHATYVSRVLRLTLLAPETVEAILDGRQARELQLIGETDLPWGTYRAEPLGRELGAGRTCARRARPKRAGSTK